MGRNPLSSQVISNLAARNLEHLTFLLVVIPYQVRSYQTGRWSAGRDSRWTTVVIPYQVRSYQTPI